jgi:purine-binding chemotaxis protein CheW
VADSRPNSATVWGRLRERLTTLESSSKSQPMTPARLAEKLAKRARALRGSVRELAPQGIQLEFLAFHQGGQRYGVQLAHVLDIQPLEHFSPIPQAPPFIQGVVQRRGVILSLLDLGKLIGIPEAGLADVHLYIVVEAAGRQLAVAAQEVDVVISVPLDDVHPLPVLPPGMPSEWVLGVYESNRLLLRMDQLLRDEKLLGRETP